MPLVHRTITPVKLSSKKLQLAKTDSEFVAVNNGTLVNVLKQLASLVTNAEGIFSQVAVLTDEVGRRIRSVKLRLDELDAKADLFEPKLVPVPEGSLDDGPIVYKIRDVNLDSKLFSRGTRPRFLIKLYETAGSHKTAFPLRPPLPLPNEERRPIDSRRPASFAALRDWKLEDYVDDKMATLDSKRRSSPEELNKDPSVPSQVVRVDVTGRGFDRMKNRRSFIIHTKKIRKKRRNTICGSMPNKECGIQTSFSSVASPSEDLNKKYGIDSGHWSSCTSSGGHGGGGPSSSSAPSPWDPASLSTSSDFLFDDEDRSLTPQLEHFTDGLVSDSDSVDTEGYFTSFRNECGFPKSKKQVNEKDGDTPNHESEYELFGKGSTSTTASSCGTVVLRNKPSPPARTSSAEHLEMEKKIPQPEDGEWEERLKRKSLIERVPSLVVVTPSPSCSSESPPPLKDPVSGLEESDSGTNTPRAQSLNSMSSETLSECGSGDLVLKEGSRSSSTGTLTPTSVTKTTTTNLPQPDVIPDTSLLQAIRTIGTPKLDSKREYFSLDTVLLGSSEEEHHDSSSSETKRSQSPSIQGNATSGKRGGARVVLDANGEIIFSSETFRRKRRAKVSFDPGSAVKVQEYDSLNPSYARVRESVYDRIRKESNDKLYECIEEIRRHNLKVSDESLEPRFIPPPITSPELTQNKKNLEEMKGRAKVNVLLETDLDSAIPPEMPELKNLPKIKDRLKRNESYRMATDEVPPPRQPLHALNSRLSSKRLSLTNSFINKKRDIPEEDPAFISQVLNMSNNSQMENGGLNNCKSPETLHRITFSKFPLTPEERPSFLRRESPPTMDEIAKEIYRFRKKFNIQPEGSSENGNRPFQPMSRASWAPGGNVKAPPPKPPNRGDSSTSAVLRHLNQTPSPSLTSTPVKTEVVTKSASRPFFGASRVFPMFRGLGKEEKGSWMKNDDSDKKKVCKGETPKKSFGGTSLNDFKKLLQATQKKRSSISAVEILKPKGLETAL